MYSIFSIIMEFLSSISEEAVEMFLRLIESFYG